MIAAASRHAGDVKKVLGRKGKASEGAARLSLNMDAWAGYEGADVFRHVFPLVLAPFIRRDLGIAIQPPGAIADICLSLLIERGEACWKK
jgi:hypothetical protein